MSWVDILHILSLFEAESQSLSLHCTYTVSLAYTVYFINNLRRDPNYQNVTFVLAQVRIYLSHPSFKNIPQFHSFRQNK